MTNPDIFNNQEKYRLIAKEHSSLTEIVDTAKEYLHVLKQIKDDLAVLSEEDSILKEIAEEEIVRWQKILHNKGWFAINWPTEFSGYKELSVTEKYILQEELAKANTPTTIPFGMGMCAPVIYSFGTEDQKQKYLPSILNSDIWWCQGYSEPGSEIGRAHV